MLLADLFFQILIMQIFRVDKNPKITLMQKVDVTFLKVVSLMVKGSCNRYKYKKNE